MIKTTTVKYRIGVDIGGTKMCAILLANDRVIGEYTLATPTDDLNKFLVILGALLEPLFEQAKKDKIKISGIGIGIPAAINNGKVMFAPNVPCLEGVKIVELLHEKFDKKYQIEIENDANCFTLGEARLGAGKNKANIYGVIIGTGIGCGIFKDNKLDINSHELGSMVIDLREKLTIEQAYHRLTQNNPKLLAEEAYQGDELATKLFEELGQVLGIGIANVINLIDPEIVIIGGSASQSSELFLREIKKTVSELNVVQDKGEPKIVISKLGKLAGAIGAALLIE